MNERASPLRLDGVCKAYRSGDADLHVLRRADLTLRPVEPGALLADEPTGNLDVGTSGIVFEELLRMVRSEGVAALIATHNPDLAARMDRRVTLRDGRVAQL